MSKLWTPLADGDHYISYGNTVYVYDGGVLAQISDIRGQSFDVDFNSNIRLCQQVDVEAENAIPIPDAIQESILELCNFVAAFASMGIGEPTRTDKQNMEYVNEVRSWLEATNENI